MTVSFKTRPSSRWRNYENPACSKPRPLFAAVSQASKTLVSYQWSFLRPETYCRGRAAEGLKILQAELARHMGRACLAPVYYYSDVAHTDTHTALWLYLMNWDTSGGTLVSGESANAVTQLSMIEREREPS